ncbi:MAG: LysR family transcriptional regulator [Pseudomonadota bacterium]
MDRFTELETFVAVAEAGGFNAGARRLGKSSPTVTRLVQGLEERLGTRLFTRTTRQIALTEAGARLLSDARAILDSLGAAEASARGAHEDPQGVLSVTAPVVFGRLYIAPILQRYLDRYPAVAARALYLDRVVNLIEEGQDVAVRIGDLPDSTLTAVKVGDVRRVVVAAPSYLTAFGAPETLSDLAAHRIAVAVNLNPKQDWVFEAEGTARTVSVAPVLHGNTVDSALDAAMSGWALTRAFSYQVVDAVRSGALVEVLPEFEDRHVPVHLVHAEGALRAAKIRVFLDHAATELRRQAAFWIG